MSRRLIEMAKEYGCRRVNKPILIDGLLDEPAWAEVETISDFVSCTDSGPVTQKTEAKLCWDDKRLYIAFKCHDSDIWGTLLNRDDPVYEEEVVEVFLDTDCDMKNYYEIEVSPRNVVFDARIFNPTEIRRDMQADISWDCIGMKTATCVNGTLDDRTDKDEYWTVEISIPFACLFGVLSMSPRDGEVWRINLYRIERSPAFELISWSPTMKPDFHIPSAFGRMVFKR